MLLRDKPMLAMTAGRRRIVCIVSKPLEAILANRRSAHNAAQGKCEWKTSERHAKQGVYAEKFLLASCVLRE
jgi:hypothetical protein